jgi:cobalt/nickel transport system permease protein
VLLAIVLASRVPPAALGVRLLKVEPFAIGVALLSLLQPRGGWVFLDTLAKSTVSLSCMVVLAATTRFSDMLRVLWRLRVPALLVTTLALMHRYLFLLTDEMGRMVRARRSRTFRGGRTALWRAFAGIVAQLFVRASERAERVYAAMCARGWKA